MQDNEAIEELIKERDEARELVKEVRRRFGCDNYRVVFCCDCPFAGDCFWIKVNPIIKKWEVNDG